MSYCLGNAICLEKVVWDSGKLKTSKQWRKVNGLVAQLNRASDYGSEGYRFESCRGHSEYQALTYRIA